MSKPSANEVLRRIHGNGQSLYLSIPGIANPTPLPNAAVATILDALKLAAVVANNACDDIWFDGDGMPRFDIADDRGNLDGCDLTEAFAALFPEDAR